MKAHEAEHKYIAGEAYMHKQDQQKHILVSKYALTAPSEDPPFIQQLKRHNQTNHLWMIFNWPSLGSRSIVGLSGASFLPDSLDALHC